jgi:hypothetical protein
VVIYPEGTRSTDGQVGEFNSGAVRLAADCGAALVPVAVLGTRDVLPKHGQVRRAPMEVRIGVPRAAEETDAAQLRSDVLALLDKGPAWARPTMRRGGQGRCAARPRPTGGLTATVRAGCAGGSSGRRGSVR